MWHNRWVSKDRMQQGFAIEQDLERKDSNGLVPFYMQMSSLHRDKGKIQRHTWTLSHSSQSLDTSMGNFNLPWEP
mgnify:FL=1